MSISVGRETTRYVVDERGQLWRHITYASQPTATLQMVSYPEVRRGGVVGSPILDGFTMLEPQFYSKDEM